MKRKSKYRKFNICECSTMVNAAAGARMKKLLLRRDYAGKHKDRMEK